jgi:hypothetical protein
MTMTDDTLAGLTDILETFVDLENINLVGNTKLGLNTRGTGALAKFIARVGRRCKVNAHYTPVHTALWLLIIQNLDGL